MLTEKDYCDYDTCVALKELGITDCSLQYYEKSCPNTLRRNLFQPLTIRTAEALGRVLAISLYNAQKWLREEKQIEVVVLGEKEIGGPYYADIYTESGYAGYVHKPCEKYEEALSEGIKEVVKILKEENND